MSEALNTARAEQPERSEPETEQAQADQQGNEEAPKE